MTKGSMNPLFIIVAVVAAIAALVAIAMWTAPEAEQDEAGFHVTGPSRWDRLRLRWQSRRNPRSDAEHFSNGRA